jgi:hypothetical protein
MYQSQIDHMKDEKVRDMTSVVTDVEKGETLGMQAPDAKMEPGS